MWCKSCNMETRDQVCPICGQPTFEDVPTEVYWCKKCQIPIIQEPKQADRGYCPICGGKTRYLTVDLRPVFPEERLLLEVLLKKPVNALSSVSVWAEANRYYIDGKSTPLPLKLFAEADADSIAEELKSRTPSNDGSHFPELIDRFIAANKHHLNALKEEAYGFVRRTAARFPRENVVISFSGGKDSTTTADVVLKALSDPSIVHIFGDDMVGKYKVITLCGSTRFKDAFMEAQKRLTLEGNIVISVGLFGHSGDDEVWTKGTKEMLDDMHKRKIDMADEIFVINVGGYIGSSTRSEIEYAAATGKAVNYLEP